MLLREVERSPVHSLLPNFFFSGHGVFLGRTQMGKTTLAAKMLLFLIQTLPCKIFIYNTQQQACLSALGYSVTSYEEFVNAWKTHKCVVFNPSLRFNIEEYKPELQKIIRHVFKVQDYFNKQHPGSQKNVLLFVDEIHRFAQKHKIIPELHTVLAMGLNPYKIFLSGATQRIQFTHNDVLGESEYAVIFSLNKHDWKVADYYFEIPRNRITQKYVALFTDGNGFKRVQ